MIETPLTPPAAPPEPEPVGSTLRLLGATPHRAWFLLGLTSALASMLWWSAFWGAALYAPTALVMPPVAPAHVHGLLMSHGLMGFFIFGFLTTVFPRWQDRPPVPRGAWLPAVLVSAAGYALVLVGALTSRTVLLAGAVGLAVGHLLASAPLLRVYLQAGASRVLHARVALLALGVGALDLLAFAWGVATQDAGLLSAAVDVAVRGYLLLLFATVGHRMIPFFSRRLLPDYTQRRPAWPLAGVALGAAAQLALGWAGMRAWAWVPALLAAGSALWLSVLWKPWRCRSPRLLGSLHLGFAWLPLAMGLYAAQSAWEAWGGQLLMARGPLHALTIGFYGTLLVAMVSRVSLGHSGRALRMGGLTWALLLGVQLVAVVRLAGELPLAGLASHANLGAAGLWLVVMGIWAAIYGPMLWRPRVDGRPG
ncbi:MAG: NnrS family protein [Alphaproteobacteria bacterium]|nr:NnrS family protein [Alphaproteobacteria bacterium]